MALWQLLIVYASLCPHVSLGQNSQGGGAQQSTLVTIRTSYENGAVVENRVPVQYFDGCTVNGEQLRPGQTVELEARSVPTCVTGGLQRYAGDLQSALRNVAKRLESEQEQVSSVTSNDMDPSDEVLTDVLEDLLAAVDGDDGILGDIEEALSDTMDDLADMTVGLTTLLGGSLNVVDDGLSGVGTVVGGVGDAVNTVGQVAANVMGVVSDPLSGITGGVGGLGGLGGFDVLNLLQGKRR